ncbi:MAG: sigma-70 family RNA polymerase sigma factor [Cyclobacteriaceae bacterium]|nr:sigma-70 family RNA polymerase sigma factor [Cyclobacteriaceae bacterium SS2]
MINPIQTAPAKKINDQKLWDQVRSDNKEAFECLYNKYFPELFRYGMTIHSNKELIGDAIQELFIDLWSYRNNLSRINRLKFYLLSSLRSKIFTILSKDNKKLTIEKEYLNETIQFLDSTEDKLIYVDQKKRKRNQLTLLINDLPLQQREAIMLIFFEGRSYEETSTMMSKSIQNVYTLVSRGVSTLRKRLQS